MLFPQEEGDAWSDPAEAGGCKPNVLLIDSDAGMRTLLQGCFERSGWRTVEAAAATDALLLPQLQDVPIDLLIAATDEDAAANLRDLESLAASRPEMRVLLISGRGISKRLRRFVDRGARVLRRPFTERTLLDRVHSLLREPRRALN
jgi:DNA-binding response OmpR family regulator